LPRADASYLSEQASHDLSSQISLAFCMKRVEAFSLHASRSNISNVNHLKDAQGSAGTVQCIFRVGQCEQCHHQDDPEELEGKKDRRRTLDIQSQACLRVRPISRVRNKALLVSWLGFWQPQRPLKAWGKEIFLDAMKPQPFAQTVM
jgi:hypothetical protein